VALVIGNGGYQHTVQLTNPPNDTRAVARKLRELGFEVVEGIDLDQSGMRARLSAFARQLEGADAALFYYAGHGLEVGDRNYLCCRSTRRLRARPTPTWRRRSRPGSGSSTPAATTCWSACCRAPRGAARAPSAPASKVDAPVGSLIACATAPDHVALDGEGEQSPFTAALLDNIATPGLEVRQVMTRVRSGVIAATKGEQVPDGRCASLGL
jgi:uncharacterized caspase-like protein